MSSHTGHDQRAARWQLDLEAQKTQETQRAQVPDDFERPTCVAIFDRRDVDQIFVPLSVIFDATTE